MKNRYSSLSLTIGLISFSAFTTSYAYASATALGGRTTAAVVVVPQQTQQPPQSRHPLPPVPVTVQPNTTKPQLTPAQQAQFAQLNAQLSQLETQLQNVPVSINQLRMQIGNIEEFASMKISQLQMTLRFYTPPLPAAQLAQVQAAAQAYALSKVGPAPTVNISGLQSQLNTAETQLQEIRNVFQGQYYNPNNPVILNLTNQIASLQSQIAAAQPKLSLYTVAYQAFYNADYVTVYNQALAAYEAANPSPVLQQIAQVKSQEAATLAPLQQQYNAAVAAEPGTIASLNNQIATVKREIAAL